MSIVKTSNILRHAQENGYGVPAINVFNYETIKWAIQAAEEERYPIIIQFYPGFDKYIPLSVVHSIAADLAARSSMPVAIHLDHSATYEQAVSGIRDGFPSVMVDGSALNFDSNARLTASVVKTAKVFGTEVEGELGHVGSGSNLEDFKNPNNFTSVEEAAEFVRITGVDSLAVSVGNGHGHYVATPELDFERMKQLRRALSVTLVLHGCSDIPDDQMRKAVEIGFSKFNIATEYFRAFNNSLYFGIDEKLRARDGSAIETLSAVEADAKEFVKGKIRILNPNHYEVK